MITKIKNIGRSFLFGELQKEEGKKFMLLSGTFFFIIGSYWIMRALKNAIIKNTVGVTAIPMAKKLSVIAIICLLLIYTKLINKVAKHTLFYIICAFYSAGFFAIAYGFTLPLIATQEWFGFASYTLIESFGSILVVLFWAFVATTVNVAVAKRGYALIFAFGQLGALLGTTLVTKVTFLGIPLLICISATAVLVIPFFIKRFIALLHGHAEQVMTKSPTKKRTSLWEGVGLLLTRPYLLGIFLIAMLYEIVVTIFDYQMQILADKHYDTTAYAAFNGFYGQLVTGVACIFALLGTRFFIKKFGMRFCLLAFPLVVAGLLGYFYCMPSLWVALGSMVTIKALSYGFNNPVKEIIYIPTSENIKFKAKSWIEMFGNRSSKAGGATINGALTTIPEGFVAYGILISFAMIGIWLVIAFLMGCTFTRLVKKRKIIH